MESSKGFTLVEVAVVMAIISILATMIVGAINISRDVLKETQHRADSRTIQTWLEQYYSRNKTYPYWHGSNNDVTICFTEFQAKVQALGEELRLASSPNDYS